MTTIQLTPEGVAPADVRRTIAGWIERHGINPRDVPMRNTVEVSASSMSLLVYAKNNDGYVLDSGGHRVTERITRPLAFPFPVVHVNPVARR